MPDPSVGCARLAFESIEPRIVAVSTEMPRHSRLNQGFADVAAVHPDPGYRAPISIAVYGCDQHLAVEDQRPREAAGHGSERPALFRTIDRVNPDAEDSPVAPPHIDRVAVHNRDDPRLEGVVVDAGRRRVLSRNCHHTRQTQGRKECDGTHASSQAV